MPLMPGRSKKAFKKNVETEMEAGKPQKQSLAIAYSVKRKAKKMAQGGSIKDEKRPMPDQTADDSSMVSRNSSNKASKEDSWTSRPDMKQSQKGPKTTAIKHPKMVPQDGYSVRLRDEEDDLQISAKVNDGPQEQPPERDNEEDPDRQGPKVPDEQRQHDNGRKPYAAGGKVEESDLEQSAGPSEDEGKMYAKENNEMDAAAYGDAVPDMEDPHNEDQNKIYGYADGGMIDNEEELEHAASIAAAIMMKMRKKMAEGGEVNGRDSIYAHPEEDQADLSRNAEEDANMEDQSSFDALRKESYSESEGLEALDQPHDSNLRSPEHDEEDVDDASIVSAIRAKMKRKSPISRQQ